MEKLGVQKQDLINELRREYKDLMTKQNDLVKTGAPYSKPELTRQIEAVKSRIDELEES